MKKAGMMAAQNSKMRRREMRKYGAERVSSAMIVQPPPKPNRPNRPNAPDPDPLPDYHVEEPACCDDGGFLFLLDVYQLVREIVRLRTRERLLMEQLGESRKQTEAMCKLYQHVKKSCDRRGSSPTV